jgi:hypothetical protein
MTFFGPSMMEKTMVEARVRKISGSSRLRWVVGAERCMFLSYTYTCGCEALGSITEPERGIRLLNPSDCTAGYALLNPSDRSIWLLTEPDRAIPSLLLLTEADRTCCLLINSERCWGLDEQDPVVVEAVAAG